MAHSYSCSNLSSALEDGHISERQRRVLDSLKGPMGVASSVADWLENDIRARLAG